jgi:hypothetical protein
MCFKVGGGSAPAPVEAAPTTVQTGDAQTRLDASEAQRAKLRRARGYSSNILAGESNNKQNKKLLTGQ